MSPVNPQQFGVSFSIKQCRNFQIDAKQTLQWLIKEAGFRRFRLMSYWDEHEKQPGKYDFGELEWQIKAISKAGGEVSLCLGARQPRWPENHWPDWAWQMDKAARTTALYAYLEATVKRYQLEESVVSYQLENEALLSNFGERPEVDRVRLRQEFKLVKRLDPTRPVIMTTSTSWGIPLQRPIPDIVGFSFYHILYQNGAYRNSIFYPWVHRLRKLSIRIRLNKPVFIHELQLEPWGPKAIWEMPPEEQSKSMNPGQISANIRAAQKIGAYPIDLWGGEWWYWRLKHGDASIWQAVKDALAQPAR